MYILLYMERIPQPQEQITSNERVQQVMGQVAWERVGYVSDELKAMLERVGVQVPQPSQEDPRKSLDLKDAISYREMIVAQHEANQAVEMQRAKEVFKSNE